jgi:hypothetical protein
MASMAFACVLVNATNEATMTDDDITLYGAQNIASVNVTSSKGVWQIHFENVFSDYPTVNITEFFNGISSDNSLNNITQNVGYGSGDASDNATAVFIEQLDDGSYQVQVVTGNADGQCWRSFALSAMGPALNT